MRTIRMLAACSLIALSIPLAQPAYAQRLDNPGGGTGAGGGAGAVGQYRTRFEQRSYTFEPTGQQMPYVLFKSNRVSKRKPAPLLIALHGNGAAPDSVLGMFAEGADRHGFIVAAPVGYTLSGWYGIPGLASPETARLSELDVMNVLELVRAEFNVDPRRIYIAGQSMGGIGAIHLASKYPDIWAAVGAISPGFTAGSAQREGIVDYAAAPVIVEHGDKDDLIPAQLVRDWVAGVKERKVTIKYNEQRGGTHFSTAQFGNRVMDFLVKQSRPEAKAAQ